MNRYIKIKGHTNWFLLLSAEENESVGLSDIMQEKILRSEVQSLHNPEVKDYVQRLTLVAARTINYEQLANKYGTILIRPSGSFMTLLDNEIIDEIYGTDFPIDDYAEIVVCENDKSAEYKWIDYLKQRFPNQKITTINYFDLRSEDDITKYFNHAKYITFSTTLTQLDWFEKMIKLVTDKHTIIGYCHIADNWIKATEMYKNIEIVDSI